MALALLVGPANAGKVARLLDRYLETLDRDPFLIVPNRADVGRVEHDLLVRRPALLGGTIGTFDDLFRRVRQNAGVASRPQVTDAQRSPTWNERSSKSGAPTRRRSKAPSGSSKLQGRALPWSSRARRSSR
jgi:hypothetical protein